MPTKTKIVLPVVLAVSLWLGSGVRLCPAQDPEAGRTLALEAVLKLLPALSDAQKNALGLFGATRTNLSLGTPFLAYSLPRADLELSGVASWGVRFRETDLVFFPVRIDGEETAGVWLRRAARGFLVDSVGERVMARAMAEAKNNIQPALAQMGLHDPYDLRLLNLQWAACQMLAVLVRDKLFLWPLPTAGQILELAPGLYEVEEVRPLLSGRSAD